MSVTYIESKMVRCISVLLNKECSRRGIQSEQE